MKIFKKIICAALCGLAFVALPACNMAPKLKSTNLMSGFSGTKLTSGALSSDFISKTADFSVELFKKTDRPNAFISPTSVMMALAMTLNGADSQTLAQAEQLFGIPLEELNNQLLNYKTNLISQKKSKLNISNAIWIREGFKVENEFLQTNADYYDAAAYSAAFDQSTVDDINKWVKYKTDKMIDKIIDEITPDHMMFLINAIAFDAQWQDKFEKKDVITRDFANFDGTTTSAKMLSSTEKRYIDTGNATGFIKPYHGGNYSFVALLPKGEIDAYIDQLDGANLMQAISSAYSTAVDIQLPVFESEFEITLNNILMDMGLVDAFDPFNADFSRISTDTSLYIGDVKHKTYVSVDANGTKAAAVTSIGMKATSAAPDENPKVFLDRPFVYAIIDNASNLPIFLGNLSSL